MPRYAFATQERFILPNQPNISIEFGIGDAGQVVVPPSGHFAILRGDDLPEALRDITIETGFMLNCIEAIHEAFQDNRPHLCESELEGLCSFVFRLRRPLSSLANHLQSCHAPNIPLFEGRPVISYHDQVYQRGCLLYQSFKNAMLDEEYLGELADWPPQFEKFAFKHWDRWLKRLENEPYPWCDEGELRILLSHEGLFARRVRPLKWPAPDRKGFRSTLPPEAADLAGPLKGSQSQLCVAIVGKKSKRSEALQGELRRRTRDLWAVRDSDQSVSIWFASKEEYAKANQKLKALRDKDESNGR